LVSATNLISEKPCAFKKATNSSTLSFKITKTETSSTTEKEIAVKISSGRVNLNAAKKIFTISSGAKTLAGTTRGVEVERQEEQVIII